VEDEVKNLIAVMAGAVLMSVPLAGPADADPDAGAYADAAATGVHCNPPTPLPKDTYQCRDGCFSDSRTSDGACSHHRGIDHPVNQGNGQ
jgi:hypothetical protein